MNWILIFGDSIAWGAWDTKGGWPARLQQQANTQAIKNEFESYNSIYPLGISGDTSTTLLQRFPAELTSRLDEESNIVVILAIGINDSRFVVESGENEVPLQQFKDNLKDLLQITRDNGVKDIVMVGLTPVDEALVKPMPWKPTHGYSNDDIKKYDQVLAQVAEEEAISFVSLFQAFMDKGHKQLLSDGLHPNSDGHELMYKRVRDELVKLGMQQDT